MKLIKTVKNRWSTQSAAGAVKSQRPSQTLTNYIKLPQIPLFQGSPYTHWFGSPNPTIIDQTHLIVSRIWTIMIVLIAFLVFGHRLPSPTIARNTTNSIVISSRRGLQTLVPPTTFSSCKGWSVLRISVIFKPWQGCCFRTEKQYIHSPSMTTLPLLSFKSEKLNPKILPPLVADP